MILIVQIIIFKTTKKITPGTPRIPAKIAVPIFNPKWKLNEEPTMLIMYIKSPPKTELANSFISFRKGI